MASPRLGSALVRWPLALMAVALCGPVLSTGCFAVRVADCDAADACARTCAVDADCDDGECVAGLCQDALPIDPNDGSAGVVRVTPSTSINLGSPAIGSTVTRLVTVENVGRGAFILEDVVRATGTSFDHTSTTSVSLPAYIAPSTTVDIEFRYVRTGESVENGRFVLATNAGACAIACDDPTQIPIDLVSPLAGGPDAISIAPATFHFGTNVGGTNAALTTLTLENLSATASATIDAITVTGDSASFDVNSAQAPPFTLAPGATESISVRYTPAGNGTHAIVVEARSATAVAQSRLGADTAAIGGALEFSPASASFNVGVVGASQNQSVTLRNVGTTSITVESATVIPTGETAAAFVAVPQSSFPFVLAGGAAMPFTVTFTAQSSNALAGALRTASNDAAPAELSLVAIAPTEAAGPVLDVSASPRTTFVPECICQATPGVSAANIDLSYRATSGAVCAKPADPSCGVNGECPCPTMAAFGDVSWGSARTETVRGAEWIIDERIGHEGAGTDGDFIVKVDLADDCLAVPGSLSPGVNQACCELDCNPEFNENAPQACFDYGQFPSCASFCAAEAASLSATDCFENGPVAIRTVVTLSGGSQTFARHFCATLASSGAALDVVRLTRTNGIFRVASVLGGVVEVSPGQECP